ncbi:MAG TPA: EAL domain-containing protein [Xanthomonadaceae bacterium]|nr:EAL domain-containing protein [Xanthomonadaceae bacterium]
MADRTPRVQEPLHRQGPSVPGLTLLLVGLLLSMFAALAVHRQYLAEYREGVERLAERGASALRHRMEISAVLARAVQAWFARVQDPDAAQFEAFYRDLGLRQSFPSVAALAYAPRVASVGPDGAAVRYPTELVAPRSGNERVLGLDVVSQPANLAALERARDTDLPTLSAGFPLVQFAGDPTPSDGVVLRLPVYQAGPVPDSVQARRERFLGSIAISFRVSTLVRDAMPEDVDRWLAVRVVDVEDAESRVLFDSQPQAWQAQRAYVEEITHDLEFGGRRWRLQLLPVEPSGSVAYWSPWLTFAFGAIASTLLALLVSTQSQARKRAEEVAARRGLQARESEKRFRALNELLPTAVLLARAQDGALVHANQAAREMFGLDPRHTGETRLAALFEEEGLGRSIGAARGGDLHLTETGTRMRRRSGEAFWASVAVTTLELGGARHWLTVASDVSDSHNLTDRLAYLASHDSLTELINRREFERRVRQRLEALDKGEGNAALLYIDIDQFKLINDIAGHLAGDQLLVALSGELDIVLPDQALLARLGGDEFGVLVGGCEQPRAIAIAEKLRQAIDAFAFEWDERTYRLTASIGIVMLHANDPVGLDELFSRADTACYMAKELGRNRIHVFSDTDLEMTRRRGEMDWVARIKQALADERLCLYYQEIEPLGQARQGVHFELLLRLVDERGHLVLPGAFLPAAERFDLMPALDRWVVHAALSRFPRLHPAGAAVASCAVNLSARSIVDPDFADFVLSELAAAGVAPERLCFEITETAVIAHMDRAVAVIERLRAHGCRFAIDDFGAGMSSFGYLKNLPVDIVKIDGSFIRDLESDPMSYSIVRAVTEIGHQSGKLVTAEFVSSAAAREMLAEIGVDFAQGYAVHRPEPVADWRPDTALVRAN